MKPELKRKVLVEATPTDVAVSAIRLRSHASATPPEAANHIDVREIVRPAPADLSEEGALSQALFYWGAVATVAGVTIGGLTFDPVGALLGAVIGSATGALGVVIVALVRGKRRAHKN